MQVALVSDIHSHLVALDAVLEDAARAGVDRVVCLGDIVDLGPQPGETVDRLRERGVACIQGNHDTLDDDPSLPFLADVEAWTREQLSDDQMSWLQGLPLQLDLDLDGVKLWCVHGSPVSFYDELLETTPDSTLRAWVGDHEFDIMACGHTHRALVRRLDERWIVNVGSTGQPFREVQRGDAAPVILPWWEYAIVGGGPAGPSVELRRVPADRDALERATRASGMPHHEQWLSQWRW